MGCPTIRFADYTNGMELSEQKNIGIISRCIELEFQAIYNRYEH